MKIISLRILSIILDVFHAAIPALGAYWGGLDLIFSFIMIYLMTQIVEILYFKDRTLGSVLCKIQAVHKKNHKVTLIRLILYHLTLSIFIINLLNPSIDIYTKIILYLIVLIPLKINNRYNSLLDLLFNLHWKKVI